MVKKLLAKYRAKRDFSKTAEPSGDAKVEEATGPPFRHPEACGIAPALRSATGTRWCFESWAVTKGPSLDPRDKRLAVEVEDHPLDYGDFEGTIPKGQYGGGTVMVWDRGFWTATTAKGPAKGQSDFTLEGEKLQGGWSSPGAQSGGREAHQLAVDQAPRRVRARGSEEPILDEDASVASGRSMDDIAAGKGRGPKAFVARKRRQHPRRPNGPRIVPRRTRRLRRSVRGRSPRVRSGPRSRSQPSRNALPPTIMPAFVRRTMTSWNALLRAVAGSMRSSSTAIASRCASRRGRRSENPEGPRLDRQVRHRHFGGSSELADCLIDGEIVAWIIAARPDFAGLQAALSEGKTDDLIFFAFDLLFLEGDDLRGRSLVDRKRALKSLIEEAYGKDLTEIRYVEHFESGGDAVLKSACRMSLEGIVSKQADARYASGRAIAGPRPNAAPDMRWSSERGIAMEVSSGR